MRCSESGTRKPHNDGDCILNIYINPHTVLIGREHHVTSPLTDSIILSYDFRSQSDIVTTVNSDGTQLCFIKPDLRKLRRLWQEKMSRIFWTITWDDWLMEYFYWIPRVKNGKLLWHFGRSSDEFDLRALQSSFWLPYSRRILIPPLTNNIDMSHLGFYHWQVISV